MAEEAFHPLDEVLLTILRMQPSEIDGLELEDYWRWLEAAERQITRRNAMMQSLYGR